MADQKEKNQAANVGGQGASSQDPVEGRPDVPKGGGAEKGHKYDTDKAYHEGNEGGPSTQEPAEGSRDKI